MIQIFVLPMPPNNVFIGAPINTSCILRLLLILYKFPAPKSIVICHPYRVLRKNLNYRVLRK